MHQPALAQAQDERVGIIGGEKRAAIGGHRERPSVAALRTHEHAVQVPALVVAAFDAQRHVLAEVGEFADLYRSAERAGTKLETEPFIFVARIRLDEADDREIQKHQPDGIIIRHAEQPAIAQTDRAQRVQFGRQSEPPEREQYPQHQPDRNAEREIFRDEVGEHLPDDVDGPALAHDEVEQP